MNIVRKISIACMDGLCLAAGIVLFVQFLPAFEHFDLLSTLAFPAEVGYLLGILISGLMMVFSGIGLIMVLCGAKSEKVSSVGLHFGKTAWLWIYIIIFGILLGALLSSPSVTEEQVMNFLLAYAQTWITYAIAAGTIVALIFSLIGAKQKEPIAAAIFKGISLGLVIAVGIILLNFGIGSDVFWIPFILSMIALGVDMVLPFIKDKAKPDGLNPAIK